MAVLTTPINLKPALNNTALSTEVKYRSAATMRPVLAHGITSSFTTFVPLCRPLLAASACSDSSSAVVYASTATSPRSANTRCFLFCRRSRLSIDRNLHWLAFIDPVPIGSVPFRHRLIHAHDIRGEKVYWRCSLNQRTKSSMRRHLYRSNDKVTGLSAGCSLQRTQLRSLSDLLFDIPVLPYAGGGMYLCIGLVDDREAHSPNSNQVINNSNPRHLRISSDVVGVLSFACSSR
jgi:hypothetical protein